MDDPFILTTFAASSLPPTVSAVAYTKSAKEDGRLCVAAHGVGVNVYDAADQTTLAALTLGLSFHPTTAAVSRCAPSSSSESVRIKGTRRTWVGCEAGEAGEVWSWLEEERKDGSTEGSASKIVYPFPQRIVTIAAPRTLSTHLVLLDSTGALSVASEADLSVVASLPSTSALPTSQLLHLHSINPSAPSAFLPTSLVALIPALSKAHVAFIVRSYVARPSSPSMVEIGKKKFKKTKRPSSASMNEAAEAEPVDSSSSALVEIEAVLLDTAVESEGVVCVGLISLGKVEVAGAEVVVSEDGFVTSLDKSGLLSSFRLAFSPATAFPPVYTDVYGEVNASLELTITPLKTFPLSTTTLSSTSSSGITILPLHSSFVLVASVRPRHNLALTPEDPPTKIIVLVWDVRLGAVVSEVKVSVPSAALPTPETTSSRNVCVALNSISKRFAALVVSPTVGLNGRSVVFMIPLSLPSQSVLAVVVGKQALTRKYLVAAESVVVKAKKAEPMRHPRTTKTKLVLIEASEAARASLLQQLETVLVPLEQGKSTDAIDSAIARADELFAAFMTEERTRLTKYNLKKMATAEEKEKERRNAGLEEKNRLSTTTKKYRLNRAKIELAIKAAGPGTSWAEVTSKRIKNVSDIYRFKYFEVRKALEEALGQEVVDDRHANAMKAILRQEPAMPSTFVTALLRLCFPGFVSSHLDLRTTPSTRVFKHPTGIVAYLLEHKLVGDSMVEGGVTRFLARSGDWPNVQQALATMVDIPEATTVALLKTVINHHLTSSNSEVLAIETDSLPFPPPPLLQFLTVFVTAPATPSTLRQAIQTQLSALEVIPVLLVLESWLGWWAKRGGGGGSMPTHAELHGDSTPETAKRSRSKRLAVNPFLALSTDEADADAFTPPRVEDILPLVQIVLDAHFVTLLLQRQSHSLLRRLSARITTHLALSANLSSLLGALSIYARTRKEQTAARGDRNELGLKADADGRKKAGESMEKRVAAQEKHMDVGEYAVDKFWI